MPNYFALINKTTEQNERFSDIDDKICEHFGIVPDDEKYFHDWYNLISMDLAMGLGWDKIRGNFRAEDETMNKILSFLENRYNTKAWYQPK